MNTNRYLHVKATGDTTGAWERFVTVTPGMTAELLAEDLEFVAETFRAESGAESETWEIMGSGDFGGVLVGRHESPEALAELARKLDEVDAANAQQAAIGSPLRWHFLNLVAEQDDSTHATTTTEPLQGGFPLWGLTYAELSTVPKVYAVSETDEGRESGEWFELDDAMTLDRFTSALVDMVLESLKSWLTDRTAVNWHFVHTVGMHGAHVALGEQLPRLLGLAETVREMNAINEHGPASARFVGMFHSLAYVEGCGMVTTETALRSGWPAWEVTPPEAEESAEALDVAAMTSEELLALSTRISEELRDRAGIEPTPAPEVCFVTLDDREPAPLQWKRSPVIIAKDQNGRCWLSVPGAYTAGQVSSMTPTVDEIRSGLGLDRLICEVVASALAQVTPRGD